MKHNRRKLSHVVMALFALFAACGDNLIADPSFDLWCNGKLCKPWEVSGKGNVSRVKTWHTNDYGVSIDDGTVLSQAISHERVDCIAFEVIADVSAEADVWLEMDFRDDGVSEYKQQVAESHWSKLRYLVKTPTWYDSVRFILRKSGKGHAVLAQIKATPSDECKGKALELLERPNGASCEGDEQCDQSGGRWSCTRAPEAYGPGLAIEIDGEAKTTCGQCTDADAQVTCGADQVCGAMSGSGGPYGPYRACVEKGTVRNGEWCLDASECASELCSVPGPLAHATCAQCASNDDCAPGEICGVENAHVEIKRYARVCHVPTARALGELCVTDAECKSNVCNEGACSECSKEQLCDGGKKCGKAEPEWLTVEASLCDPGAGKRKRGAACTFDTDCVSGECKEPDAICNICLGPECKGMSTSDCGFLRKLAGTCR